MMDKTRPVRCLSLLIVVIFVMCGIGESRASQAIWLDTLDLTLAEAGYGRTRQNRSIDNNPIRLAGVEYKHGVGTHPPGRFLINLAGRGDRFTAVVGIDDEKKTGGSAEFIIKGDGKILWSSGIMRGGQAPKPVDVDIRGVRFMDLVVTVAGDGYGNDHTDWANAKIAMLDNTLPKAATRPKRDEFTALCDQIQVHQTKGRNALMRRVAQEAYKRDALILDSDRDAVDVTLRRTESLLVHLQTMLGASDMARFKRGVRTFKQRAADVPVTDLEARRALFNEFKTLRRQIVFSNPLADFDKILFIKRHFNPEAEKTGNHMCDQYFGFNAIKGGGLFVLEDPFSSHPTVRNVLETAVCENGRFKGRTLTSEGGFLSPELSWDGQIIFFAYTDILPDRQRYEAWTENNTWHIFKVNVDGSHLRQLTDGPFNDFDPCVLPSGRVAFISERRGGYGRCHGRPVPSFTLHSMLDDGRDIVTLSPHETNEWQPSVDNSGMIAYTRWDYVDRGFNQAHHPWTTTPDGRDSRAIQGNFAPSDRIRPHSEMDVRAIPNSHKLIATAACHHGQAYGSLVLVDPRIEDDDAMAQVRRVTPDQLFPEAENAAHRDPANYATAWPLSDNFYLCVYDSDSGAGKGTKNNYGIYLLDAFGNRELLYRDPAISCLSPIPLRARTKPPIIPHATERGKPLLAGETYAPVDPDQISEYAQVGVTNVYQSRYALPKGATITALRIIQLLPKTTPYADNPRIGYGAQKGARAILGTVPVEEDGSAYFNLPVDTPVYFQAIDENGLAVQSMRSATYVHPGEKLICHGCHDNRSQAPVTAKQFPTAMSREPSNIDPEPDGTNPFSFARLVQPVLDKRCVACHTDNLDKKAPDLRRGVAAENRNHWYQSYLNLRDHSFFFDNAVFTTPRTIPGKFGARASRLYHMLKEGHHDVELAPEEMHRITLWLDSNSDFFGSYENLAAQANGEIVLPTLQ
ncbi:MAG: hypothetical protein GY809_06605 [Planctomycetes bacterium]|nr:hypothetical protein [Planctomycetota bacterium]